MGSATKHLRFDGSADWPSFLYQFEACAKQLRLSDTEMVDFLKSTLAGPALKLVASHEREYPFLGYREICLILSHRFDYEGERPEAAWLKLDNACQEYGETLHQWADRLRDIGHRMGRGDRNASGAINPKLIMRFCLFGSDRESGRKAIDTGPPRTLQEAVERVQWFQHVESASRGRQIENRWETKKVNFRERSPDDEQNQFRDPYWSRGNTQDPRGRYGGEYDTTSRGRQYSPGRNYSGGYESYGDSRNSAPLIRAMEKSENTVAECRKFMENLGRKVDSLSTRLECVNLKTDRIDGLCSRLDVMDGKLQSMEQRLRNVERRPMSRSPSPGAGCYYSGEPGHFRAECPKRPTVRFEYGRCSYCGDQGHTRASCPKGGNRLRRRKTSWC